MAASLPKDPSSERLMMEEGGEAEWDLQSRRVRERRVIAISSGVLALVAAACGTVLLMQTPSGPKPAGLVHADVQDSTGLVGFEVASALIDGLTSASRLADDMGKSKDDIGKLYNAMSQPELAARAEMLGEGRNETLQKHLAHLKGKELLPQNSLVDDNPCPDNEEHHAGLCYKTCAHLTNDTHPIRTSAFSCCKEEPCSFFNSKMSNMMFPCTGLDVAGGSFGGLGKDIVCPHKVGDCLRNEEFNGGMCYYKCAILTQGTHPYRGSSISCCRYRSAWACGDVLNLLTNTSYDRGGGVNDSMWEKNASLSHPPLDQLA